MVVVAMVVVAMVAMVVVAMVVVVHGTVLEMLLDVEKSMKPLEYLV